MYMYNSGSGTSAGSRFTQDVNGRYVERYLNYTNRYIHEFGVGVTDRYSDFSVHWWRNSAGSTWMYLANGRLILGGSGINSATSLVQSFGDISIAQNVSSLTGNTYYDGAWRYFGNGYPWVLRSDGAGYLQIFGGAVNSSGPGALYSPITHFSMDLTVGNLGLGVSVPSVKLDVAGSIAINRNYIYLGAGGDTNHAIHNTVGDGEQFRFFNFLDLFQTGAPNISRLYINTDGNVGIGTTTPSYKLHVLTNIGIENTNTAQFSSAVLSLNGPAGTTRSTKLLHGNNNAGGTDSYFSIEGYNAAGSYLRTLAFYSHSANYWGFFTSGTERVRINDLGYVGINTTTPITQLNVNGTIAVTTTVNPILMSYGAAGNNRYIRWQSGTTGTPARWDVGATGAPETGGSAGSDFYILRWDDANISGTTAMFLKRSNGYTGIGNNSPSYKLEVSGDVYANGGWFRVAANCGYYFEAYGGGWYMADSTYLRTTGGKVIYHSVPQDEAFRFDRSAANSYLYTSYYTGGARRGVIGVAPDNNMSIYSDTSINFTVNNGSVSSYLTGYEAQFRGITSFYVKSIAASGYQAVFQLQSGGGTNQRITEWYASQDGSGTVHFRNVNDAYSTADSWLYMEKQPNSHLASLTQMMARGYLLGTGRQDYGIEWGGIARKDQNKPTPFGIVNNFVGLNVTAELRQITGTANAWASNTLSDNNGNPYYINTVGTGVPWSYWNHNNMRFQNGNGTLIFEMQSSTKAGFNSAVLYGQVNILANSSYNANEWDYTGLSIQAGGNSGTMWMGYDSSIQMSYINSAGNSTITPLALNPRGGEVAVGSLAGRLRYSSSKLQFSNNSGATWTDIGSGGGGTDLGLNNVKSFGAVGNGSFNDTVAINAAIADSNITGRPIYFPPGVYIVTSALTPIRTSGVRVYGAGAYASKIYAYGNFDLFTFSTNGLGVGKLQGSGLINIGIFAENMTGGHVMVIDFVWYFGVEDVFVNNPYQLAFIRQNTNVWFQNVHVENTRGSYCVRWYGDGQSRNGESDRSDVINFISCVLTADYYPNNTTTNLIWMDGFVQTLQFHKLQLLRGARAFYCSNSPGLPLGNAPFGIIGSDLEAEFSYYENIRADWLSLFWVTGCYLWGSRTSCGAYFGANTTQIKIVNGKCGSNWAQGFVFDGSSNIDLHAIDVYDNSQQGNNIHAHIRLGNSTVTSFAMVGGSAGTSNRYPSQHQASYGIDQYSGYKCMAVGVDLTGNGFAAVNGGIYTYACWQ